MTSANKICIGTANFAQKYGKIKNNKVSEKEIKKILNYCKKNNINDFDTAYTYKNEDIVGNLKPKNWTKLKISSKLPIIPKNIKRIDLWMNKIIDNSLNKLKISKLNILYIHNLNSLLSKNGPEIYSQMVNLKKKGLINKVGISSYNPKDILKIINQYKIDVVQLPFNYLDQTLLENNTYKLFIKNKIEIYVRSIFLQGVLLTNNLNELQFNKLLMSKYQEVIKSISHSNLSKYEFALNFIIKNDIYKQIVFGIDSLDQLKKIQLFRKRNDKINYYKLSTYNKKIIYPHYW